VTLEEGSQPAPARRPLVAEQEHALVRSLVEQLYDLAPNLPLFPTLEGFNRPLVPIGGRTVLNFAGYNYLGLAHHPEVLGAAHRAIDDFGTSAGGSRLVSGQNPIHLALEEALAAYLQVGAALVFVGGHATNESVIGHLLKPGDAAFVDEQSHNSILQGVRLSGARMVPFGHNSARRCERLLARSRDRFERVLVVVEGVYSMNGDMPDLAAFVDLRERYEVTLMVDEAHSFGVIGDGRGITAHCGVEARDVDIIMGTLSKSLASCGGFIAGRSELIEYLRYTTPGFVFSVAPPPSVAAAALAALEVLAGGRAPLEQLRHNCDLFAARARETGIEVVASPGVPIITVPLASRDRCAVTAGALFEEGLLVQPVIYPAVNHGDERLRFFVTAAHTDDQIGEGVSMLAKVLSAVDAGA